MYIYGYAKDSLCAKKLNFSYYPLGVDVFYLIITEKNWLYFRVCSYCKYPGTYNHSDGLFSFEVMFSGF